MFPTVNDDRLDQVKLGVYSIKIFLSVLGNWSRRYKDFNIGRDFSINKKVQKYGRDFTRGTCKIEVFWPRARSSRGLRNAVFLW